MPIANYSQIELLYIPLLSQTATLNWVGRLVAELGRRRVSAQVFDLHQIHWHKLWGEEKKHHLSRNKPVIFQQFLPFSRFKIIYQLNVNLNLFWLFCLWRLQRKCLVIVCSVFDQTTINLLQILRPQLLIADACDYSKSSEFPEMYKRSDVIITNSYPLTKIHRKHHARVRQISAGYFLQSELNHLSRHFQFKPKQVIFIGTIDWRLDMEFVLRVMKLLLDHIFNFYYVEQFGAYPLDSNYEIKRSAKSQKLWKTIKELPNFRAQVITSQQELTQRIISGSVGLMAYSSAGLFNRYAHPIKFYDYLSLGIPVVSKPILSLAQHYGGDYLFTAESVEDLGHKIRSLSQVKYTDRQKKKMLQIASEQTIEKKAQELIELT